MKIILFGATGATGKEVTIQALQKGFDVTLFVRNPEKVIIQDEHIHIIIGDVLNEEQVSHALVGMGAALVTLGVKPGANEEIIKTISQGTKNIIEAMEKNSVKKLIVESSYGVAESFSYIPLFVGLIMKAVLGKVFADKAIQEEYIKNSQLDWVIVRPVQLTNGARTGSYKTDTDRLNGYHSISRADVADFMLKQLTDATYANKIVNISS